MEGGWREAANLVGWAVLAAPHPFCIIDFNEPSELKGHWNNGIVLEIDCVAHNKISKSPLASWRTCCATNEISKSPLAGPQ